MYGVEVEAMQASYCKGSGRPCRPCRPCRLHHELLDQPEEVEKAMRCLGPAGPRAGDGLIALPTMIHRGPGSGPQERLVLFFSIRPVYKDIIPPPSVWVSILLCVCWLGVGGPHLLRSGRGPAI